MSLEDDNGIPYCLFTFLEFINNHSKIQYIIIKLRCIISKLNSKKNYTVFKVMKNEIKYVYWALKPNACKHTSIIFINIWRCLSAEFQIVVKYVSLRNRKCALKANKKYSNFLVHYILVFSSGTYNTSSNPGVSILNSFVLS